MTAHAEDLCIPGCIINKFNYGVSNQLPAISGHIKSKQHSFTLNLKSPDEKIWFTVALMFCKIFFFHFGICPLYCTWFFFLQTTSKIRNGGHQERVTLASCRGWICGLFFLGLLWRRSGSQVSGFDYLTVRRSGLGVVSWTCDPVLALGQRFDSHFRRSFCCNPLGVRDLLYIT